MLPHGRPQLHPAHCRGHPFRGRPVCGGEWRPQWVQETALVALQTRSLLGPSCLAQFHGLGHTPAGPVPAQNC